MVESDPSLTAEIETNDSKTSRLETILGLGKNITYGAWGFWMVLEAFGLAIAPVLNIPSEPVLTTGNQLFPVITGWTTGIIGIIIGKELK